MARAIDNVSYEEAFILNSRGFKLFTTRWIPMNEEPKALVFICHNYGMDCRITMKNAATQLAKAGFAVYGIDYEGHGRSAGIQGCIDKIENLVDDCFDHFMRICENEENKGKTRFLLGDSMGGAVSLLLHRKEPGFWHGAVLVAPFFKVADTARFVIKIMNKLSNCFQKTSKSTATYDLINMVIKDPENIRKMRKNPYSTKGFLQMRTAYELLKISLDLEQNIQEASLPFLVLQGEENKITTKSWSRKQPYNAASIKDKTFVSYSGMQHALLSGERTENTENVVSNIIDWLQHRTSIEYSLLEREEMRLNEDTLRCKQE